MTYYTSAFPTPVASRCCICGESSVGLWCDQHLEPFIERGHAFRPEVIIRGPLAALAVLARTLVNSGARVSTYSGGSR